MSLPPVQLVCLQNAMRYLGLTLPNNGVMLRLTVLPLG